MAQQRRVKRAVSGWLVFDKPFDMSSTEAVGRLRWLFQAKKAGHAGTLDPLATGILPIAFGEATKTVPAVQDGVKVYRFALNWGVETASGDAEGEVVAVSGVRPGEAAVRAVLERFTGAITQVPPAFSAIKIEGRRAYDRARAGEEIEMPARTVEIARLALLSHDEQSSDFEVECAKGTYIRALARDIAEALGTRGHVGALQRTRVGGFSETDAVTIEDVEAAEGAARDALLMPVAAGLGALAEVRLDAGQTAAVRRGNPVLLTGVNAPVTLDDAWASFKGEAVAIGCVAQGLFKPRRVILPV